MRWDSGGGAAPILSQEAGRPNVEQALRASASRQKLRIAFAKLPSVYQTMLVDRLPAHEAPNWRVADSTGRSSANGRVALSVEIEEFRTASELSASTQEAPPKNRAGRN